MANRQAESGDPRPPLVIPLGDVVEGISTSDAFNIVTSPQVPPDTIAFIDGEGDPTLIRLQSDTHVGLYLPEGTTTSHDQVPLLEYPNPYQATWADHASPSIYAHATPVRPEPIFPPYDPTSHHFSPELWYQQYLRNGREEVTESVREDIRNIPNDAFLAHDPADNLEPSINPVANAPGGAICEVRMNTRWVPPDYPRQQRNHMYETQIDIEAHTASWVWRWRIVIPANDAERIQRSLVSYYGQGTSNRRLLRLDWLQEVWAMHMGDRPWPQPHTVESRNEPRRNYEGLLNDHSIMPPMTDEERARLIAAMDNRYIDNPLLSVDTDTGEVTQISRPARRCTFNGLGEVQE